MNGTETILLVDDNENDLQLMRTAFKWANLNTSVQMVQNGVDAIAYLKGDGIYQTAKSIPCPSSCCWISKCQ